MKYGRGWFEVEARRRARNAIIRNAIFVVLVLLAMTFWLNPDIAHQSDRPKVLAVEGLFVVLFAWRFLVAVKRKADPSQHPLLKEFARYGDQRELVAGVEAEVEEGAVFQVGDYLPTSRFLVHVAYPPQVVAFDDIAWVYVKETRRSINFIPVGTTRSLEIFTFSPAHRYVSISATVDEQLVAILSTKMSRGRLGYTAANEAWWNQTRDALPKDRAA